MKSLKQKILEAIEDISGDDFCNSINNNYPTKNAEIKLALKIYKRKMDAIYKLSHIGVESCANLHTDWKDEFKII